MNGGLMMLNIKLTFPEKAPFKEGNKE